MIKLNKIKYWFYKGCLKFFFTAKIRKYVKSLSKDEDFENYLLDLLKEDERKLFIKKDREYYDYDLEINQELQKQIHERDKK